MNRFQREQWAHNLAESIDDVYERALVPEQVGSRKRHRRVSLVANAIFRSMGNFQHRAIKQGEDVEDNGGEED